MDSGYHVSATTYTTLCLSLFNFAHLFVHGLKMCMWFGFNSAVNFCHFSTLLTCHFSQKRNQLHQSLIYIFSDRWFYKTDPSKEKNLFCGLTCRTRFGEDVDYMVYYDVEILKNCKAHTYMP